MSDSTSKPVHTLRLGSVQAAIWNNTGQSGSFYNVTFERRYRDANEEWKSSGSFGRDDLLLLAKLADQAHSWIVERLSENREHKNVGSEETESAKPAGRARGGR